MMVGRNKILLIIVILVLMAGGIFYFFKKGPEAEAPAEEEAPPGDIQLESLEEEVPKTFGEKIYQLIQSPAEKIPQTNPFKAKTNPFEGLKINPFEDIYKNPFGE